jgi:cytochrome c peroxidase
MKISRFKGGLAPTLCATLLLGAIAVPSVAAAEGFGPIVAPEVDAAKAELGKRLFFDKRLSGDAAIS